MIEKEAQIKYYQIYFCKCLIQNKYSRQKERKETIRRAYISNNMEIYECIESLEKECKICKFELSKVQKEKMKENY